MHRPNEPIDSLGEGYNLLFLAVMDITECPSATPSVLMRFGQAYTEKHCQNEPAHRLEALQLAVSLKSLTFALSNRSLYLSNLYLEPVSFEPLFWGL